MADSHATTAPQSNNLRALLRRVLPLLMQAVAFERDSTLRPILRRVGLGVRDAYDHENGNLRRTPEKLISWVDSLDEGQIFPIATAILTDTIEVPGGRVQAWAHVCLITDGTYTRYLHDLDVLWTAAENRHDLLICLTCATITSVLRQPLPELPPRLIAGLARVGTPEGSWSSSAINTYLAGVEDDGYVREVRNLLRGTPHEPTNAPLWRTLMPSRRLNQEPVGLMRQWQIHLVDVDLLTRNLDWLGSPLKARLIEIPDLEQRARAFAASAQMFEVQGNDFLIREVISTIRQVAGRWSTGDEPHAERLRCVQLLLRLLNYASWPYMTLVLGEAMALAADTPADEQADLLVMIGKEIPGDLQFLVFRSMSHLPTPERVRALVTLQREYSSQHESDVIEEALKLAARERDGELRARALAELATSLPSAMHARAWEAATLIVDEEWRIYAQAALAPRDPEIIQRFLTLSDSLVHSKLIAQVIGNIPETLRSKAVLMADEPLKDSFFVDYELIERYHEGSPYDELRIALAPYDVDGPYTLAQILVRAKDIADEHERHKRFLMVAERVSNELLKRIAECVRYQSVSNEHGVDILIELVQLWPASQSRSVCSSAPLWHEAYRLTEVIFSKRDAIADGADEVRAKRLYRLAPYTPQDMFNDLLSAIRSIRPSLPYWSIAIQIALIPRLSKSEREGVCWQALQEARALRWLPRVRAEYPEPITALIGVLPWAWQRDYALEALQSLLSQQSHFGFARALVPLCRWLPPQAMSQIIQTARSIDDPAYQSELLAAAAPRVSLEQRARTWAEALLWACAIEYEWDRALRLAALIEELPIGFLAPALAALCAIEGIEARAEGVRIVANTILREDVFDWARRTITLPKSVPRLIEETAAEIKERVARSQLPPDQLARALLNLIPDLPRARGEMLVSEVIGQLLWALDEAVRAQLMLHLSHDLPDHAYEQCVKVAYSIRSDPWRAVAIIALASHVPNRLLPVLRAAALGIADPAARARALASLLASHDQDRRPSAEEEVLRCLRQIAQPAERADACVVTAPYLGSPSAPEVAAIGLTAARAIDDSNQRARTLAALCPSLPHDAREDMGREVLDLCRQNEDDAGRLELLLTVAPTLPQAATRVAYAEALGAACREARRMARHEVSLPTHASVRPLTGRVQERSKSTAVGSPEHAVDRFRAALKIPSEIRRLQEIEAVIPQLPAQELGQVLQATRDFSLVWMRAQIISALAPHLPESLISPALSKAYAVSLVDSRAHAIAALLPRLSNHQREHEVQKLLTLLPRMQDTDQRHTVLTQVAVNAPHSIVPNVVDTAWTCGADAAAIVIPILAEQLHPDHIQYALSCIDTIPSPVLRTKMISTLSQFGSLSKLYRLFHSASKIQDVSLRVEAMLSLLPMVERTLSEASDDRQTVVDFWKCIVRSAADLEIHELTDVIEKIDSVTRVILEDESYAEVRRIIDEVGNIRH